MTFQVQLYLSSNTQHFALGLACLGPLCVHPCSPELRPWASILIEGWLAPPEMEDKSVK